MAPWQPGGFDMFFSKHACVSGPLNEARSCEARRLSRLVGDRNSPLSIVMLMRSRSPGTRLYVTSSARAPGASASVSAEISAHVRAGGAGSPPARKARDAWPVPEGVHDVPEAATGKHAAVTGKLGRCPQFA